MACFACPRQCDFYLPFKLIAAWSTNLSLSGAQTRSKASFGLAPICFQNVLFSPPKQTLTQHCCKLPSQKFLRSSLQGIHPQAHGDRYQKNDCQQNANADHHFLFHTSIPSFQICHLPYTNIDAKNRKMFLQCMATILFCFLKPPIRSRGQAYLYADGAEKPGRNDSSRASNMCGYITAIQGMARTRPRVQSTVTIVPSVSR